MLDVSSSTSMVIALVLCIATCMQRCLTDACMFGGLHRVRAFVCCSFVLPSLTVVTTASVRVSMSMTAGYGPAPHHTKSMHYYSRPLRAAAESPLSLEPSNDSSYVSYEPHMHIPSVGAHGAQGAPQQHAPPSVGSRMVAPRLDPEPFSYFANANPTMPIASLITAVRQQHRQIQHSDVRCLNTICDILGVRTSQQQQQQQQQQKPQEWRTQQTHQQTHDQRSCSYRCDYPYHTMQKQKGGGVQSLHGASACKQRASCDEVRRPEKGGSVQQRRPMLPPFNAFDSACMHTSLEPSCIATWRTTMQSRIRCKTDRVEAYNGIADECFNMPTSVWREACLEPSERGARRAEFNSYLAEGLHKCFDRNSCHVQGLQQCLSERGARAMLDGRLILDMIAQYMYIYKCYMDAISTSDESMASQLLAMHASTPKSPPPQPVPSQLSPSKHPPPRLAPQKHPPAQPSPPKPPPAKLVPPRPPPSQLSPSKTPPLKLAPQQHPPSQHSPPKTSPPKLALQQPPPSQPSPPKTPPSQHTPSQPSPPKPLPLKHAPPQPPEEEIDGAQKAHMCSPFAVAEHIPIIWDEVEQCDVASYRFRHTHYMASRRLCHAHYYARLRCSHRARHYCKSRHRNRRHRARCHLSHRRHCRRTTCRRPRHYY